MALCRAPAMTCPTPSDSTILASRIDGLSPTDELGTHGIGRLPVRSPPFLEVASIPKVDCAGTARFMRLGLGPDANLAEFQRLWIEPLDVGPSQLRGAVHAQRVMRHPATDALCLRPRNPVALLPVVLWLSRPRHHTHTVANNPSQNNCRRVRRRG